MSKTSGEKMAYTSVPRLNTIPASMDTMIMHAQAVRRGAPHTFVLGCMPYQSYNTIDRALTNATLFMHEADCDAVNPKAAGVRRRYWRHL